MRGIISLASAEQTMQTQRMVRLKVRVGPLLSPSWNSDYQTTHSRILSAGLLHSPCRLQEITADAICHKPHFPLRVVDASATSSTGIPPWVFSLSFPSPISLKQQMYSKRWPCGCWRSLAKPLYPWHGGTIINNTNKIQRSGLQLKRPDSASPEEKVLFSERTLNFVVLDYSFNEKLPFQFSAWRSGHPTPNSTYGCWARTLQHEERPWKVLTAL